MAGTAWEAMCQQHSPTVGVTRWASPSAPRGTELISSSEPPDGQSWRFSHNLPRCQQTPSTAAARAGNEPRARALICLIGCRSAPV